MNFYIHYLVYNVCFIYSVYGTICGVVVLMILAVGGVVCVGVYIRFKLKGKGISLVLCCKHYTLPIGRTRNKLIELEQNSAYEGIMKMDPPLNVQNMEECPAYGVIH